MNEDDERLADGPAQRAGLRSGGRIVAVDASPTPDVDTLQRMLSGERIGQRVRLDLLRGTQRLALDLVPDLVPDRHGDAATSRRG